MFGYVKAYKPELKMSEYETYRAVYCSLCRTLGKDYGIAAKMILSYDFTFFALVRLSVGEQCCGYTKMRCPFNPMKKCMRLDRDSEEMHYTAACAVLLFYYKLLDNIYDSGFFGRLKCRLIYPFFARHRKKAAKRYPEADKLCAEMTRDQQRLEGEHCGSADRAAEPTAALLSKLLSRRGNDDVSARVLSEVGYLVGKWIYLIDALDDLSDDLKHNNYNVIAEKYHLTDESEDVDSAKREIKALVNVCNVQAAASFELLGAKRYKNIIQNVLYLGMQDVLNNLDREKSDKSRKEW